MKTLKDYESEVKRIYFTIMQEPDAKKAAAAYVALLDLFEDIKREPFGKYFDSALAQARIIYLINEELPFHLLFGNTMILFDDARIRESFDIDKSMNIVKAFDSPRVIKYDYENGNFTIKTHSPVSDDKAKMELCLRLQLLYAEGEIAKIPNLTEYDVLLNKEGALIQVELQTSKGNESFNYGLRDDEIETLHTFMIEQSHTDTEFAVAICTSYFDSIKDSPEYEISRTIDGEKSILVFTTYRDKDHTLPKSVFKADLRRIEECVPALYPYDKNAAIEQRKEMLSINDNKEIKNKENNDLSR